MKVNQNVFQFNPLWLHTVVPYLSLPALLILDIPSDLQSVCWLKPLYNKIWLKQHYWSPGIHQYYIQHILTGVPENVICWTRRTWAEFLPEWSHTPENKQTALSWWWKELCCRMLIPHKQMSDIQVNLYVNSLGAKQQGFFQLVKIYSLSLLMTVNYGLQILWYKGCR